MRSSASFFLAFACLQHNIGYNKILGARGPIQDAIASGLAATYHRDECIFKRESEHRCPDPDLHIYLHKYNEERIKLELDGTEESKDWLKNDLYDKNLDNIMLIHGYNGGDGVLPTVILRDAYLRNGSYNVFVMDWGALVKSPCYPAAVANLHFVAKCFSIVVETLKNLGISIPRTTCVGHSLGAHVCGIMANYLPFRWQKIIGMDPAKPLVRPGRGNRLDSRDANFVQVVHTNAGYFGENMREGHVDFCANGGKIQPFCENAEKSDLCSHNWSLCFMADSIDGRSELYAGPCSGRCPPTTRIGPRDVNSLVFGQHTPTHAKGTFCISAVDPPFCPKFNQDRGDERCCV